MDEFFFQGVFYGFLFLWFLFAVLIGGWNHNKGNPFLVGFGISIFFTPLIGLIVVAISKTNQMEIERRSLKSGKSKKCPFCGEIIRTEAKVCRYCQRELTI